MTRVQPEGPASKILQPGDKIIQVQINFWRTHLRLTPVFNNKTCFSLPGQWIQLCEHRSWLRSVPPEDLSKHCGFDDHQRRAGVDSADVWMGAHEETVKTLVLNLVFFYTETDLLGLFILMELGKPLNVWIKQDCGKPLQVWVLERPSLWYIYFYTEEADDTTCSDAVAMVSVQIISLS